MDLAEIRFTSCESPLKLQRHLIQLLAIIIIIATAHTALSAAFYLLHTVVVNGAMNLNKFGNCFQWRREILQSEGCHYLQARAQ
jgi:hypothetical protein